MPADVEAVAGGFATVFGGLGGVCHEAWLDVTKPVLGLQKRRRASECSTSNAAQTVALLVSLAHALLPYVVNALLKSLPRQQPPGRLKHSLLSVCSATPDDASRRASKPRRQPTESTVCSKCSETPAAALPRNELEPWAKPRSSAPRK